MQHDVNMVRKECCWALTNSLCRSTPELAQGIVNEGFFTASNYSLEIQDARIIFVALEGIKYALQAGMSLPPVNGENPFVLKIEQCGLLDKMESLQEHSNEQVYDEVSNILQTYFADEEDLV